jgi:hypothetical protein
MPENPFTDKNTNPDDKSPAKVLGESSKLWHEPKKHLTVSYGELIEEWKFYSPKYGWTLKLLKKKRNLFFFSPRPNGFRVSFVFGDKAVSHIEASNLPDEMKTALRSARKYAEGRGISIEVKSVDEIEEIKKLVEIKLSN